MVVEIQLHTTEILAVQEVVLEVVLSFRLLWVPLWGSMYVAREGGPQHVVDVPKCRYAAPEMRFCEKTTVKTAAGTNGQTVGGSGGP